MPSGRRTVLSITLALGLALTLGRAAMSAQKSGGTGRCLREAAQAELLGADLNPGKTNVIAGTEGDDVFGQTTEGPDLICGFGGGDQVSELNEGDVFLGGAGPDTVFELDGGTFNGGPGDDRVTYLNGGTFNGGAGIDFVHLLSGGTFNQD